MRLGIATPSRTTPWLFQKSNPESREAFSSRVSEAMICSVASGLRLAVFMALQCDDERGVNTVAPKATER